MPLSSEGCDGFILSSLFFGAAVANWLSFIINLLQELNSENVATISHLWKDAPVFILISFVDELQFSLIDPGFHV